MSSLLTAAARPKARGHCQKQTADATPDMCEKTTVFKQAWGVAAESGALRLRGQALPKGERPGMADRGRFRLRRRRCTDLAKRGTRLVDQKLDDVPGSVGAQRAKAPQKGLAGKRRLRAQRQRAHHVGAAAYAAVHQDYRPTSHLCGDAGQHVDRGG